MNKLILNYIILVFFLQGSDYVEPYEEYKKNSDYYISKIDANVIIDGQINEPLWKDLQSISNLVQVSPNINSKPSNKTDIKMCYNDEFLYISVKLDQDKNTISFKSGEYDDFSGTFDSKSDYFILELDTFHDHETSYGFAVNSSGVQSDYIIYDDEFIDDSWNGLWYSSVQSLESGWSIEYKIPFNILRFSISQNKTWGLDFIRYIKNNNEYISWVPIPDTKPGIVSHYGHLYGIDITQKKSTHFRFHAIEGEILYKYNYYDLSIINGNPDLDTDIQNYKNSVNDNNIGFSLKHIINSNSNIDLTVNPNYEHINQDPSEINNTPYETYQVEKRPFFLENEVFFKTPIEIFYSRRIGGVVNTSFNYSSSTDYKYDNFLSDLKSAIKYTAKNNERSYGMILSYSEPLQDPYAKNPIEVYSSIVRFSQNFKNNQIGFIATNNSKGKNISNVYGIDYSANLINNQLYIDSQIAFSDINTKIGKGYNFKLGYKTNSISILDKSLVLDFWFMNNQYDSDFHISDLGYLFRNDLKENHIGFSIEDAKGITKRIYTLQYEQSKNYSNDILSDIISFQYNILMQNLDFFNFGVSIESEHFADRFNDYFLDLDINKIIKVPSYKTINIGYGNDLRNDFSYEILIEKFTNDLHDNGIGYNLGLIYHLNNWMDISFSYNKLLYDETYHFLKIRQLPSGINSFNIYNEASRTGYEYLFTNSINKEIYYTAQISAYLDEIILQVYSEYFIYENDWTQGGQFYKIGEDDDDYIYPMTTSSNDDLDKDKILYNAKYSSINLNFVLKWNFINNSNIFFIYSLNKSVNGKIFSNPRDLIEFSIDEDYSWHPEIFYDNSLFIKCEFYFNNL
jgi:hypothetical protein